MGEFSPSGVPERIRRHVGDLSPSERRVARAVLAGPPTVGLESSARLAERAGVSGPTVSRFVQRLGFDGYGDFQRALHEDIAAWANPPDLGSPHQRSAVPGGPTATLIECARVLSESVEVSVRGLNPVDVAGATDMLADVNRAVLTAGGWFSQVLASHLAAVLQEIRPRVRAIPPIASERAAAIADVAKKDVVVVFDFRRYERDTQDFATAMRAAGARVLLFTDPWLSPISELAEAVLPARVAGPSSFDSLTPALAVVEALLTTVAEAVGESGHRRIEQFGAALADVRTDGVGARAGERPSR